MQYTTYDMLTKTKAILNHAIAKGRNPIHYNDIGVQSLRIKHCIHSHKNKFRANKIQPNPFFPFLLHRTQILPFSSRHHAFLFQNRFVFAGIGGDVFHPYPHDHHHRRRCRFFGNYRRWYERFFSCAQDQKQQETGQQEHKRQQYLHNGTIFGYITVYQLCRGGDGSPHCLCYHDAATAFTTTTTRLCFYAEQPLHDDEAAAGATAAGCGAFDPQTHLTRVPVTGKCRLDFVALFNSCDAMLVVAGDGFGVMVEASLRTDWGAHDHHKRHKDKNPIDNSGLLLRFSNDAGVTYYNFKDPRNTVPLDRSSPPQKLTHYDTCFTACGKHFQGWSCDSVYDDCSNMVNEEEQGVNNAGGFGKTMDKNERFETCFALGGPKGATLCWSISRLSSSRDREIPCVPNDSSLNGNLEHWYIAQPRDDGTCGPPCGSDGFIEQMKKD